MWKHWPARELPKIDIGGTEFYLDLRLWEFRDVDDFMNRINIDDLFDTETGFVLCFDPSTKNLFQGTEEEYQQLKDSLKIIELPSLGELDAIGWKAYVETWKEENPVLSAMIEEMPEIINQMPHPLQKGVRVEDLLPQNEIDKTLGKKL
jgi:hypothetical protein